MQLDPAAVTERMRVKLGETRPPAESLDDLPHPVVGHTTLLPVASAAAVTHHKHRVLTATTNPLLRAGTAAPGRRHRPPGLPRTATPPIREVHGTNDTPRRGEGEGRPGPAGTDRTLQRGRTNAWAASVCPPRAEADYPGARAMGQPRLDIDSADRPAGDSWPRVTSTPSVLVESRSG